MCDTLVVLPSFTDSGATLFAKNSDREPNEPNIPVYVPRTTHPPGCTVRCTYIEVEQVPVTWEVFLVKPSWMWGAEMGVNEHGVAIGNEAVFSRVKTNTPALTGMDLVRLALERARTSQEAIDLIIALLERYGQGGNCGYRRKLWYDSSFLIADPASAWLIETAGNLWAVKRVSSFMTISNAYTLGEDYDDCSPGFRENSSVRPADFKKHWEHSLMTRYAWGEQRRRISNHILRHSQKTMNLSRVMDILRHHAPSEQKHLFHRRTYHSLCMHGGGLFAAQTTGSLIAELSQERIQVWFTGSSLPCLSLFKPFQLTGTALNDSDSFFDQAESFWTDRERLHRMILGHRIQDLDRFLAGRNTLEKEIIGEARILMNDRINNHLLHRAFQREKDLIKKKVMEGQLVSPAYRGSLYHRLYWSRQNRLLFQ